jgi:hypothetical protein
LPALSAFSYRGHLTARGAGSQARTGWPLVCLKPVGKIFHEIRYEFYKNQHRRTKMKNTKVKENHMNAISKITSSVFFAAILAGLILVGSGSAFAQEVLLTTTTNTFTNTCPGGTGCADWGFTVGTEEPSTAEPVVVIWSARYEVNKADLYYVGLSVNGGECQVGIYGPENLVNTTANPSGHFLTATFQWIVEASNLKAGTSNSFEVCGGGDGSVAGDSVNVSQNTLTVAKY